MRSVIHGVDFSGATNAGRGIWIASGGIEGETVRLRPGGAGRLYLLEGYVPV